MTFCLGWVTETAAFLVADSAVTYLTEEEKHKNRSSNTSFGEKQGCIDEGKKYVYEEALKLYIYDRVAITFSGSSDFGNELVELIENHLIAGKTPLKAIENTIKNFLDFSEYESIKLLIACYESEPIIYFVDNKGKDYITEVNDFISIGSASSKFKKSCSSFYKSFLDGHIKENYNMLRDEIFLLKILALTQSYGVNNYTIEDGLGGAYSGLYITKECLKWQPDICYSIQWIDPSLRPPIITAVFIRDNNEYIINTNTHNIVLSNSEKDEKKLRDSFSTVIDSFDSGVFEYFIFINKYWHVATIIHMNRKLQHDFLFIDIQERKKGTIGMLIDSRLNDMCNDFHEERVSSEDITINHIPYIPISNARVESIKSNLDEVRITKTYNSECNEYKCILYGSNDKVKEWFYIQSHKEIFAFVKHYIHEIKIHIVNCISDSLEMEVINGVVIFPEISKVDFSLIIDEITDKKIKENLYLFDLLVNDDNSSSTIQYTIRVLSDSWDKANIEAKKQAKASVGDLFILTPIGIQFYHPAYT